MLIQKYNGHFGDVVRSADEDALRLLDIIVTDFPSFNDFSIYDDCRVFFYKRAQLVISDVYQIFKSRGLGDLKNVERLTAFADYKIPQVLRRLGILGYSQELAAKVDNRIPISHGSKEEVEIRANTIWAIELMRKELRTRIPNITAVDLDSYLWLQGQDKSPSDKPYHLTRTVLY